MIDTSSVLPIRSLSKTTLQPWYVGLSAAHRARLDGWGRLGSVEDEQGRREDERERIGLGGLGGMD